jgi:cation transport ATPase
MSDYLIKSALAVLLLAAGTTAFLSMMARFGRPGNEARSEKLRRLHKKAGWVYVVLLVPLAIVGAGLLVELGDGLTIRAAFHFVLALALLAILKLKILVVKAYRQQLRYAPTLGMTLFALTLIVFLITAGYFWLLKIAG